jgi:hypothetical protein
MAVFWIASTASSFQPRLLLRTLKYFRTFSFTHLPQKKSGRSSFDFFLLPPNKMIPDVIAQDLSYARPLTHCFFHQKAKHTFILFYFATVFGI